MLRFWDEMTEMAVEHLKLSDLNYVLGSLASSEKIVEDGKSIYWYQVNVTEVNFIIQHSLGPTCQSSLKLEPRETKSKETVCFNPRTREVEERHAMFIIYY